MYYVYHLYFTIILLYVNIYIYIYSININTVNYLYLKKYQTTLMSTYAYLLTS